MRLSQEVICNLQQILADEYGIQMTTEECQLAGLKIIRLVFAKEVISRKSAVLNTKRGL